MAGTDLLFVYGSLRCGAGHDMGAWLRERATACGAATVAGRLYAVGWYPALVAGEGVVHGELYRLHHSGEDLRVLDVYEEVRGRDDDEYERLLAEVRPASGPPVQAWVYFYRRPVAALRRVTTGDWLK